MYYDISESRLDISNGKCKPKFGFEKLVFSGCGLITVRRSRPFYSLLSTKHELFSAVDLDGVIGGVFLILLL